MQPDTDKNGQIKTGCGANAGAMRDDLALPPLAAEILRQLEKHKRQTINDLDERMQASRSTIKLHLRALVHAGLVRQHGKGKATWYTL